MDSFGFLDGNSPVQSVGTWDSNIPRFPVRTLPVDCPILAEVQRIDILVSEATEQFARDPRW
jgi:hypothetical protein